MYNITNSKIWKHICLLIFFRPGRWLSLSGHLWSLLSWRSPVYSFHQNSETHVRTSITHYLIFRLQKEAIYLCLLWSQWRDSDWNHSELVRDGVRLCLRFRSCGDNEFTILYYYNYALEQNTYSQVIPLGLS